MWDSLTDPVERAAVEAVDADSLVADLTSLVAIPSTGGSRAEVDVQGWVAQRCADLGLGVDHWQLDLDALRADPGHPGEEVDRPEAWGVAGWTGSRERTPALVLCGHTDVVPSGSETGWGERDPWQLRREDDVLLGRGSCDMKGGVAAMLGAVAALRGAGIALARPLALHSVIGEEDGGLGTFATLRRGHTGEQCVIAEPTTGSMLVANSGALTFRLEVDGMAAHGALRTHGVSAIDHLMTLLRTLRELEAERNAHPAPEFGHLDLAAPLSVGMVASGDWASTVPDLAVAEGRYGVLLGEPTDVARRVLEDAVAAAAALDPWLSEHPPRLRWIGGQFASGSLPHGHPLAGETARAITDLGRVHPRSQGAPYGSDLRTYANAGVPTLQYGPGLATHAHTSDEQVTVTDLVHCAKVYALLAVRICGVA